MVEKKNTSLDTYAADSVPVGNCTHSETHMYNMVYIYVDCYINMNTF